MRKSSNIAAAGLALFASALLSLIDNFVIAVSEEAGLWQFQFFRTLFALPLLFLAARIFRASIRSINLPRLAAPSLAISLGLPFYFASFGVLPVARAGAGLFSASLRIVLLSVVVFLERISPFGVFAVALGFVGTLIVTSLRFRRLSLYSGQFVTR